MMRKKPDQPHVVIPEASPDQPEERGWGGKCGRTYLEPMKVLGVRCISRVGSVLNPEVFLMSRRGTSSEAELLVQSNAAVSS
jgi:hypothetical protein